MNQSTLSLGHAVLASPALACASCAGLDPHARVPGEHIVMVNYRGNPVDPTSHPWLGVGHYREADEAEFTSNLILGTSRSRDSDAQSLPIFTNIFYMADADSVQKTERAVYSYMLGPRHRVTNFFALSLNDRAEVAETTALYLAPKRSLLVWIDRFFAAVPSMPDERAGRLQNQ